MPNVQDTLVREGGLVGYVPAPPAPPLPLPSVPSKEEPGESSMMRCPLPAIWDVSPDSLRHFYSKGRVPQSRVMVAAPPTAASGASITTVENVSVTLTGGGGGGGGGTLSVPLATLYRAGIVKPDGTTIRVDGTGKISALATPVSLATTTTPGIVEPDGTTITVDGIGKITAVSVPVPIATTGAAGIVKPDGTTITVDVSGTIAATAPPVSIATSTTVGTVKPDNTTITVDGSGTISATAASPSIATTSTPGIVKPDGTTISVDGAGKISTLQPIAYGVAGITVDGGVASPTTGSKGYVQIPYPGTIVGWSIIGDQSGSVQFDVKICDPASFPSTVSIVASGPPAVTTAQAAFSSTITGWTTAVADRDVLEFVLTSVTNMVRITLEIKIQKG